MPIPLHLFLGLTNDRIRDLIDIARQIDSNLVDEIEKIFRQNGIDNRAWYGDLVGKHSNTLLSKSLGNQVHKLLSSNQMLESIRALVPCDHELTAKFYYCVNFLHILGKIQHFARARRLEPDEVSLLENEIDNLRNLVIQVPLDIF